jgi:biopolymer transport protein ExbB
MTKSRRAGLAIVPCLFAAAPAVAQENAEGGQSLLDVFFNGIEWPAYFILAGSVVAITLIIEHFLTIRRASIAPVDQVKKAKEQIENRNFRECMDGLKNSHTFFASVMTAALGNARYGFDAMHEAALEKSGENSGRMFRKAEYLNILGNLGPLLGLLGTVWGMIIAFGDMAATGGAASGEAAEGAGGLARGISLALVNTLLGLSLAIIGLGFFGVCRNRIDSMTVHATVEALDVLEYFRPSASGSRNSEARRTARPEAAKAPAAAKT